MTARVLAWFKTWHWPSRAAILRALGAAALSGLATLGLLIVAVLIDLLFFNNPPIVVTSLDAPYRIPFCPGQEIDVHKRIEVDSPVQLFTYFEITSLDRKVHIPGTNVSNGARSYDVVGIYDETFPWIVPDIPPGWYNRKFTTRGTDGRENSIFTDMKIEIGSKEDCDE